MGLSELNKCGRHTKSVYTSFFFFFFFLFEFLTPNPFLIPNLPLTILSSLPWPDPNVSGKKENSIYSCLLVAGFIATS